jgi:hypothetical protein
MLLASLAHFLLLTARAFLQSAIPAFKLRASFRDLLVHLRDERLFGG